MKRNDPRHGTYSGYQAHRKEGVTACKSCREAYCEYMRQYRQTNPNWRDQENARKRALWRLVDLHRDDFDRLYVEERNQQHVEKMRRRSA